MGRCRLACAIGFISACTAGGAGGDGATLAVDIHGPGHVTASPVELACAGDACSLTAAPGQAVTLTAVSDAGSAFAGWGGACSGSSATCTIELTPRAAAVTATFASPSTTLAVMLAGAGSGSVSSDPAAIDCTEGSPAGCTAELVPGTSIALVAAPAGGSSFLGWTGGCTGAAATCTTAIGTHLDAVTARFEPASEDLTVHVDGQGTVTATPGDLACGDGSGTCAASLPYGTAVTLTATPSDGWRFDHWDGACATAATCHVSLDAPAAVHATFAQITDNLAVVLAGAGSGEVVATSAACTGGECFACPAAGCSTTLDEGTSVTLTASASADSQFAGWSGPCTGTGTCTLTIAAMTTVHATFDPRPEPLTVELTGAGTGNVSATGLIDCGNGGTECAATVPAGTPITLTAKPDAASRFAGWSGACSGASSTCVVTLHDAATVTAAFDVIQYTLTVSFPTIYLQSGDGVVAEASQDWGSIVATGSDGSTLFDCGSGPATCSVTLPIGSQITLTGTPRSGASLLWGPDGGACSGAAPCTVVLTGDLAVDAVFSPAPISVLDIAIYQDDPGNAVDVFGGSSILGTCPYGCTDYIQTGTVIDLGADSTGSENDIFGEWDGPCWTSFPYCEFTLASDTHAIAEFKPVAP